MMVPITGCLSQLKWEQHFCRPNPLNRLQIFDEASRGPWGSFVMLYRMWYQALLASALALLILISLGIDTSAQQILGFPQRLVVLSDVSAEIGMAETYHSKGLSPKTSSTCLSATFVWDADNTTVYTALPNTDLLSLQTSLVNGISGSVFQPYFQCPGPATECSWGNFTTLGVCGQFEQITNITTPYCNVTVNDLNDVVECNYRVRNWSTDNPPLSMKFSCSTSFSSTAFRSIPVNQSISSGITGISALGSLAYINVTGVSCSFNEAKAELYMSTWYWCTQTFYNITASQQNIRHDNMEEELLTVLGETTPEVSGPGPVETNSTITPALNDTAPPSKRDTMTAVVVLEANSTGKLYNVTQATSKSVSEFISQQFNSTVYNPRIVGAVIPLAGNLDFGAFLSRSDLRNFTQNIATTLTNQIRSSNPGDNYNAMTFYGDALGQITYVEVRWPWIILPMVETLLTSVLLAITIFITRKRPLLKTSIMGLLVHGLDGWSADELDVDQPETTGKLEELATGMTAVLDQDEDGRLKFLRR